MNRELAAYLRLQVLITAVLNFFIAGMIAGLIYHQAVLVPADSVSVVIDIMITSFLTFAITAPFARASLRRDKTGGVIEAKSSSARLLSRLSRRPLLMCILIGTCTVFLLSVSAVSLLSFFHVISVPFYLYVAVKSVSCSALGAFVTGTVLYAGMLRTE